MDKDILVRLQESRYYVTSEVSRLPKVGIILGSGLGGIIDAFREKQSIPYRDIPHFCGPTVEGHAGELIIGTLGGVPTAVMNGRLHYYEGYSLEQVTYPVRLLRSLGVDHLVITSAVGAINPSYRCGDLVFIEDHINFMGADPLRREHYPEFGERFPDMTEIYRADLRRAGLGIARKLKVRAHEGIYFGVRGPSYETPAEIRCFRRLGGDIVGMSVVPEAIVANQMGVRVIGISYVSNLAAGVCRKHLRHRDVLAAGEAAAEKMTKLLTALLPALTVTNDQLPVTIKQLTATRKNRGNRKQK